MSFLVLALFAKRLQAFLSGSNHPLYGYVRVVASILLDNLGESFDPRQFFLVHFGPSYSACEDRNRLHGTHQDSSLGGQAPHLFCPTLHNYDLPRSSPVLVVVLDHQEALAVGGHVVVGGGRSWSST